MFSKELQDASELVKKAGEIILKYYDQDVDIEYKKGDGPVTEADKASNEFLVSSLRELYPDDAILSEESKDDRTRLSKRRVWLVDPMDGTREFIDKVGQFSAMIGLVEKGRPVLGVVYQPTTGVLFSAAVNMGAFISFNGERQRMQVSDLTDVSAMRLVVSRSHRSPLVDAMKESMGIKHDIASGSVGLKVGLLVQQKCDLYLHPNSKTKEWDTCAPEVIVREAGGKITDCWGEPLRYNKENVYNQKGFVVSNGKSHFEIIDKIRPFLDQMD